MSIKWLYSSNRTDKGSDDFSAIHIRLASWDKIKTWSYGEVKKPDTINYRTYKPEFEGLFCEKIFGPIRDYECACGKYKRIRYKGVVCDRCGVEVTHHKVRRERMGHIDLAVPVVHIWYYSSLPSIIGNLLGLTNKQLEKVIYYESYVVVESNSEEPEVGKLISEEQYYEFLEQGKKFKALIGGEAIMYLLKALDLEEIAANLRIQIKEEVSEPKKLQLLKRLKIVDRVRQSSNEPEWMVYSVIPVIPPDLRPLVPLEGGRFASSDLNDLYRRVINRNNRLKKLLEIDAPEVILKNEKRMLQEAIDSLWDNGRRKFVLKGEGKRPLKSMSDMLKGKKGRFRQNLLGKRVDYSGRSVIVVGPELKIFQAGIPKVMALELFKPFVIAKLEKKGIVHSIKTAKKMISDESSKVWEILEEIIEDHPILLNRAPTLHRVSVQGFFIKLTDNYAIRLSPFVCSAFNADFDGDQMAVHVPLSFEAQLEVRIIMLSTRNTLSPASGRPLAVPSQDTVLGVYYITKVLPGGKGEGKRFSSLEEATFAYENGIIDLHSEVYIKKDGEIFKTSYGRMLFNTILPQGASFVGQKMNKKALSAICFDIYRNYKHSEHIIFLDNLKDLGFEWATKSGLSIGMDDINIPEEKDVLVHDSLGRVNEIRENYDMGFITERERYSQIVDIWTHTTNKVVEALLEHLEKEDKGFNPLYMMVDSGARGSKEQVRQLAGMRGLMAKPRKKMTGEEIIESPIISNFKEGLDIFEYFISTHGARKGLADTALKTADAGYLTRRLVDVSQDVVVAEVDCGTSRGVNITPIKQGDEIVVPLSERIAGRFALETIKHPYDENVLVDAGGLITEEKAFEIEKSGVESVFVRSVLSCESNIGVCQSCYGIFPGTGKMVEIGTAVGVVASQSIGEPGTQLTLRTFHIGGTATRVASEKDIYSKAAGVVQFKDIDYIERKGKPPIVVNRNGEIKVYDEKSNAVSFRIDVPVGAFLLVREGEKIKESQQILEWDPYNVPIISDVAGEVTFKNFIESESYIIEKDDVTGMEEKIVIDSKEFHPYIEVVDKDGGKLKKISLPVGSIVLVEENKKIESGAIVAKMPRQSGQSTDITGGLPRIAELFEVKNPSNAAIISEVDGVARIGDIKRRQRIVYVVDEEGIEHKYSIPIGKHIFVLDGHKVKSGEKLCEGPVSPHDILRVKGISAVQEYLLNEIQDVYRIQGVGINDKHIECIVRQMMKKVRIIKDNDTPFLEGDLIDRLEVLKENKKAVDDERMPCEYEPIVLGITKAALTTESFISAASFQETTRVLTNAAVAGKKDTLNGLKENVIIGRLIPVGTGNRYYNKVRVANKEGKEVNVSYEDNDLSF